MYIFVNLFMLALISQQPQSPKEQPKKGDQKGDDNKKQGGKHLYKTYIFFILTQWIKSVQTTWFPSWERNIFVVKIVKSL